MLIALAPAPAGAQWTSEFGVLGGIGRLKPTGTSASDQTDIWTLPGGFGTLFAVITLQSKVALEPSVTGLQFLDIFGSGSTSVLNLGLRGDYAVTAGLYGAAGGVVAYAQTGAIHETQLGLQVAAGYRLHLSRRLQGRVEAQAISFRRAGSAPPFNFYALLFGVAARLR